MAGEMVRSMGEEAGQQAHDDGDIYMIRKTTKKQFGQTGGRVRVSHAFLDMEGAGFECRVPDARGGEGGGWNFNPLTT